MFDRLLNQFPHCDQAHLNALAAVWTRELELILTRMFEICAEEGAVRIPARARHEAVFELAKLSLWLEDRIIAVKTSATPIHEIDPVIENESIASTGERERIENTARNCADAVWKRLYDTWWKKYPEVAIDRVRRPKLAVGRASSSTGVRVQHFSPVFSNKLWAGAATGKVRVYSIDVAHRVTSKDVGYRSWGHESFIYSQQLERLFGLVEGDAKIPYMKLLRVEPFSEPDRRHWVAFLATQLYRTPWFIVQNLSHLKQTIGAKPIAYPTDIASLRRAYETLFTNDDVFAAVYRLIVGRKWAIWRAPAGCQFVRSDNPVLVSVDRTAGTTVYYPMSPEACFVAGAEVLAGEPDMVPTQRQVDERATNEVNRRTAISARHSVIARPEADDTVLRAHLESRLGRRWIEVTKGNRFLPEYWGDLA